MGPLRVLHVINGMGSGGAEAFIMNIYRNIDRTNIQFDFLLRSTENMYFDEIESLGGRIFVTNSFPRHALKNYKDTTSFFKEHKEYGIVHIHANALIYMTGLIGAKKEGIPCIIMHSHSTQARKPFLRIIHELNKVFLNRLVTNQISCSEPAGKWMFNSNDFLIINNGIDVERYIYNETVRYEIRKEFQLDEKFVIGHIGRFLHSKNHLFLIDIFAEVYKKNKESVLLLIGTGPFEKEVHKKINKLGLESAVIFTGVRNDIEKILQAMDVFLFPSFYEGLGIVAIEAQAAGLHTVVSEAVPNEAFLTNLIESIPLSAPKEKWAERVLCYQQEYKRQNTFKELQNAGYDIESVAKEMELFYISKNSKNSKQ